MKKWVNLFLLSLSLLCLSLVVINTNANIYSRDKKSYPVKEGNLSLALLDPDKNGDGTLTVSTPKNRPIRVKNEGQVNQFVRVMALPIVTNSDGVQIQAVTTELLKGLNVTDWKMGEDGYFYYLKKLEAGKETELLFNQVESTTEGTLTLKLKVEAITAEGDSFVEAWWLETPTTEPLVDIYTQLDKLVD